MIHRRKALSHHFLSPRSRQIVLERCIGTNSGHCHVDMDRKNQPQNHSWENEGDKIRLLKSRGQHLLKNPRVLDSIVRTSNIEPDDTVLEIGPGTGNLTFKLLEAAKNVVAVEIDNRMVETLQKGAAERGVQDRLKIISGDVLKTEFPEFNLVVANIPYNISSPLLAKLIYGANKSNPFRSATLLLQKEFATRLLAKPGDSEFNRLAVNMSLLAEIEFVMNVSKRDFFPCPRVDSCVVKIYPKNEIPDVDLEEWCAFTRTCFNTKNKTLGATFKQKRKVVELMKMCKHSESVDGDGDGDGVSSESGTGIASFRGKIVSVLESGRFLDKRPSKMSNHQLLHLLSLFNEAGIYFHDQKDVYDGACLL